MTAEQAVSRYVAEILRVVNQRASIEVEAVSRARQHMQSVGGNAAWCDVAAHIASNLVRRKLWSDEA